MRDDRFFDLKASLGYESLAGDVERYLSGGEGGLSCLVPDLKGVDPDDAFSSVGGRGRGEGNPLGYIDSRPLMLASTPYKKGSRHDMFRCRMRRAALSFAILRRKWARTPSATSSEHT